MSGEYDIYIDNKNAQLVSARDFTLTKRRKGNVLEVLKWEDIKKPMMAKDYDLLYGDSNRRIEDNVVNISGGHVFHLKLVFGIKDFFRVINAEKTLAEGLRYADDRQYNIRFSFKSNVRRTFICRPKNRYIYKIGIPLNE